MTEKTAPRVSGGALAFGVILGFIVGGAVSLWRLPTDPETLSPPLRRLARERLLPVDPIAKSMAEGKAAARRHQDATGR